MTTRTLEQEIARLAAEQRTDATRTRVRSIRADEARDSTDNRVAFADSHKRKRPPHLPTGLALVRVLLSLDNPGVDQRALTVPRVFIAQADAHAEERADEETLRIARALHGRLGYVLEGVKRADALALAIAACFAHSDAEEGDLQLLATEAEANVQALATAAIAQPGGEEADLEALATAARDRAPAAFERAPSRVTKAERDAIHRAYASLVGYEPDQAWHDGLMSQLRMRAARRHDRERHQRKGERTGEEITAASILASMRGRAALSGFAVPAHLDDPEVVAWVAERYNAGGGGGPIRVDDGAARVNRKLADKTIAELVRHPAKMADEIRRDAELLEKRAHDVEPDEEERKEADQDALEEMSADVARLKREAARLRALAGRVRAAVRKL